MTAYTITSYCTNFTERCVLLQDMGVEAAAARVDNHLPCEVGCPSAQPRYNPSMVMSTAFASYQQQGEADKATGLVAAHATWRAAAVKQHPAWFVQPCRICRDLHGQALSGPEGH